MSTERLTSQKQIIQDYLKGTKEHPSAEKVYQRVRKKLPRISLGTVYRNLKTLEQKGMVAEIPCEVAHYDADTSVHAHFVCQNCQRIFDVYDKVASFHCRQINNIEIGEVKNYQLLLYGTCRECQSKLN